MLTITFTGADARKIAAVAVAAETSGLAPIIGGVHVIAKDGTATVTATDRYMVARARFDATGDMEAVIPAKEIVAALKPVMVARAAKHTVTLTCDTETWTVAHPNGTVSGACVAGKYPPVDRLFPKSVTGTPGAIGFSAHMLERFGKTARAMGDKKAPVHYGHTAATGDKPGPIYGQVAGIEFMLQPNLLFEGKGPRVADTIGDVPVEVLGGTPGEIERLRDSNRDLKAKVAELEAAPVVAPVFPAEALAEVPNLTEKMIARLKVAVERGDKPDDAATYALGTTAGKRAEAVLAILNR